MALWILPTGDPGDPGTFAVSYAVLVDSVTETAFGPLIRPSENNGLSAVDAAEAFLAWLEESKDIADARSLSTEDVCTAYGAWVEMVELDKFR